MSLFIRSSRFQKTALLNILKRRTREFRLLDTGGIKLTQYNRAVNTLIQQRLYATGSSLSRESTDNSTLGDERESASFLSKHESDDSTGFTSVQELMSNNQTDQVQTRTNNKFEQDWSKSFFGLSSKAFSQEVIDILLDPINIEDIECKPDGMIYLPEIKYRRILNKSFGPGGWGMAPRGENSVSPKTVSREYALVCNGRLVSVSRGEQDYFDPSGLATAAEGAKSNALMRCCKDLGIASELWDPNFIRDFKKRYCEEIFVEHIPSKRKKKIWVRKGHDPEYPYVRT